MSEAPLLPVHVAARLIVERIEQKPPEAARCPPQMLDGVANLLCVFTTVYARGDGRPLLREEVAGGAFCNGGREMVFPDGRPKMADLCVDQAALDGLIERFRRLGLLYFTPRGE